MAPTTFTLASLSDSHPGASFLSSLSELPTDQRPFWVGKTHHWMDPPELSRSALYQDGSEIVRWDYLVVSKSRLPTSVENAATERVWSITTDITDDQISALATAKAGPDDKSIPPLPAGWSPADHSGLDAAIGPKDLELSLSLESYPLGSDTDTTKPVVLKDFIRDFGKLHPDEPVAMLNLLAYLPGQREKYLPYAETFQKSTGSERGGQPLLQSLTGAGGADWSTRQEDEAVGSWRNVLVVGYPSIWHFGKMLDDEGYQEADRKSVHLQLSGEVSFSYATYTGPRKPALRQPMERAGSTRCAMQPHFAQPRALSILSNLHPLLVCSSHSPHSILIREAVRRWHGTGRCKLQTGGRKLKPSTCGTDDLGTLSSAPSSGPYENDASLSPLLVTRSLRARRVHSSRQAFGNGAADFVEYAIAGAYATPQAQDCSVRDTQASVHHLAKA